MNVKELAVEQIRTDGGTQARAEIDSDKVSEYREAMEDGCDFPPVVVFHDGSDHWLADGFHRFFAAKRAGFKKLKCDFRQGTKRDAILFAVGCNGTHGLPRTNADKRKAVMMLLEDEEWKAWTPKIIAEKCCVSRDLVEDMKREVGLTSASGSKTKYIDRHGNESVMNTANIGKGIRVLAHEIGEDDEPESPKASKQYLNTDTGEVMEESQVAVITTKPAATAKRVSGKVVAEIRDAVDKLEDYCAKSSLQVSIIELRQLVKHISGLLSRIEE